VVLVIALVLGRGGVAYATIPDSGGAIHSCCDNSGTLSVVDAAVGRTCKHNETQLNWNQTAPAGLAGHRIRAR
jgi:hypothetical protein